MEKTRDDLIESAKYGLITPQEAEAEAKRLNLAPLAFVPDPAKYDPLGEEWWTLVMTVAWIARRDVQLVREAHDPYRLECIDWHFREWRLGFDGPIYKGYLLESRRRTNLIWLTVSLSYDAVAEPQNKNLLTASEAEEQLWKALKRGQLHATGRPAKGGARVPIPDYEWNDLVAAEEKERDVVRDGQISSNGYNDVMVRRSAVMSVWPGSHELIVVATGSPGRPTSMHLVAAEHKRRLVNGLAERGVRAEAKVLEEWLKQTHPKAPTLTAKTIENNIRTAHRTQKTRK